MTGQQLNILRYDISFRMIEANEPELNTLEQELYWIEELIKEQEKLNGEETSKNNS